jgi:ParB-like chromosome segregation protein Spo0J
MNGLDALVKSIEENDGLLEPILIRSDGTLLAGARRLAAYKQLGRKEIEVYIRDDFDGAVEKLIAERDENICREPFKPTEYVALGRKLEELERPKARDRQAHGKTAPGRNASGESTKASHGGTREKVGDALGISGFTYLHAKQVVEAAEAGDSVAQEAVKEMDRTGKVNTAHRKVFPKPSNGLPTKTDESGREQPVTHFGKGDKWQESTEPLTRYLAAWKKRDYEFAHLNPREATNRLKRIDSLIAGLEAARADLEPRSQKAKLTLTYRKDQ